MLLIFSKIFILLHPHYFYFYLGAISIYIYFFTNAYFLYDDFIYSGVADLGMSSNS